MKLSILAGATSQSINVFVRDSTSTTGAGLAAVAPAGGSLLTGTKLYYSFSGANASAGVAVSLAVLAAVNTAWTSGDIVTIDGTNMIGWNRIDIPNSALAAGKGRSVSFMLYGGTNMAPCPFEIELTGWDNQDGVRGGMTALPNAAANAANGLPISIAGALDLDEMNVDIEAIQTSTAGLTYTVANQVDANTLKVGGTTQTGRDIGASVLVGDKTGFSLTAGEETAIANAVWDTLRSSHVSAGTYGLAIITTDPIKRNTAYAGFPFSMTESTNHTPQTGLSITAQRSIDGAAYGACANAVVEVASGSYTIDLAAADLNCTKAVMLKFTAAATDTLFIALIPQAP
jgi:hypothetical protein